MVPDVPEFLRCVLKDLSQPLLFDGQQAHVFNFLQYLGGRKIPSEGGHGGFCRHIPFPFPFGGLRFLIRESKNQRVGSEVSLHGHGDSYASSRNNGLASMELPSGNAQGGLSSLEQQLSIHLPARRDEGSSESSKQLLFSGEEADLRRNLHGVVADDVVVKGTTSRIDLHPLQKQLENLDSVSGPVSKEGLGRATWTFLHTLAAQFPEKPTRQQQRDAKELMAILSRLYPCKECADHFKEVLKANPVQAGSGVELAQWMCMVHNVVNRSLAKPVFPCQRVDARWGALDCDGACDLQGRMH